MSFGEINVDRVRLIGLASVFDLVVTYSLFHKRRSYLSTFHSGTNQIQIDHILFYVR